MMAFNPGIPGKLERIASVNCEMFLARCGSAMADDVRVCVFRGLDGAKILVFGRRPGGDGGVAFPGGGGVVA